MGKLITFAIACLGLTGCIGVDYLDDPIVGSKIVISAPSLALMTGQTQRLTAVYFNKYGVEETAAVKWSVSSTAIASVDNFGTVSAKSPGQALIFAFFEEAIDTLRLTVVGDENSVAQVRIAAANTILSIGETQSLALDITNINGQPLIKSAAWKSGNPNAVTISSAGLVTAIANGVSVVTAEVDFVVSNEIVITVGTSRSGNFVKSGGYEASGTATLKSDNGNVTLDLSSDFKTSFALGTFIYLSNNNTSGSAVKSNGLEIQQITQGGAYSFNVSARSPGIKLSDYKYVIILCKPATVIFGSAELK